MRADPRPLRVLIVDDCHDTAESFRELFLLYGHEARSAESGAEAMTLIEGWRPDVAILDLAMPRMSGYELAPLVRATGCGLLVAMTGWCTPEHRAHAAEAGFDHCLIKPVDPDVLTDLLRTLAAHLLERSSHVVQ
ncbi:response regulator [Gemmata sp. G18]|uniref:Response regulator n=1 Tax=Gemmata palustris TaxID=2822762 RepID=A0ABS5BSI2_9BACT|nr:response regulator [Gemmata palustris]MBP3956694.1 response regulator [Gemmata palustris]